MNQKLDILDHLLWINLPEDLPIHQENFPFNPAIPLPVEPNEKGKIQAEELHWEKIIAAILLVLAHSPSHPHAPYYRDLLKALRPDLQDSLSRSFEDCLMEKDWKNAEEIILALRGLEPGEYFHRISLANFYAQRSQQENRDNNPDTAESYAITAETAYREILMDTSPPIDARYHAGVFQYHRGDFFHCQENLSLFLEKKRKGKQQELAQRLLHFCKEDGQSDPLYSRAYQALNKGKKEEGKKLAQQFHEKNPHSWAGFFILGWSLRLNEDWEEAQKAFGKSRELGCRQEELYKELAICARALHDNETSEKMLKEVLRYDPENIRVITNIAIIQIESGKEIEAIRWLKTALIFKPSDKVCLHLLQKLEETQNPIA